MNTCSNLKATFEKFGKSRKREVALANSLWSYHPEYPPFWHLLQKKPHTKIMGICQCAGLKEREILRYSPAWASNSKSLSSKF